VSIDFRKGVEKTTIIEIWMNFLSSIGVWLRAVN
jgi:hypothetical protein